MKLSFNNFSKLIPYFILAIFAFLYFNTIFPGVGGRVNFGDSAKFQYLWAINGTPHSTGYPQILILSKLFGHIFTFFEPYYRIVLISTLCGLLTLFVIYKISKELIEDKFLQVLPMLIFGTSYIFWSQSTEMEVYALHSLYVSSVVFFSIKFYKTKKLNYLLGTIALYCLSFGNHLTMITMLPALIYLVAITDYKLFYNKKVLGVSVICAVLGASQYLYIWWLSYQGSPVLEYLGPNASFSHFIDYITGREHEGKMGQNLALKYLYEDAVFKFFDELWRNIGWAIGVLLLSFFFARKHESRTEHRIWNFIGILCITHFVFVLFYQISDIKVYYIPIFLYLSLLIVRSIDQISSKKTRIVLSVISVVMSVLFMNINYSFLQKIIFNPYSNLKNWANAVPPNSNLYTSYELFHNYHGQQSINYMKYLDNDKEINLINRLDTLHLEKEIYVPGIYSQEPILNRFYTNATVRNTENLLDFLEKNKENTIVISAKDDAKNGLTSEVKKKLVGLGLHFNELHFRGSYIAIIEKGKVVFEKFNNSGNVSEKHQPVFKKYKIEKLASAGYKFGNYSTIIIDGKEYSQNLRGLNMVVIDSKTNEVTPCYSDTFASDEMIPIVVKMKLKDKNL